MAVWRGAWRLVPGAVALGAIMLAASALGAGGGLSPAGCIQDDDTAQAGCARSAAALEGAHSLAISPDGASLYLAAWFDDALVSFARDPANGRLTAAACVQDDDSGAGDCAASAEGLEQAHHLAVSPDGESVYVASVGDDALAHFERDPATGALTAAGCVDDDDPSQGPDGCAQSADGLDGAHWVAISPDGESVYVASRWDDAVAVFDRDPDGGELAPAGCVDDVAPGGPDDCAQSAEGLDDALSLAVSADGKSVYAVSKNDSAVVRLDRDPGTGALAPRGCVEDLDAPAAVGCARASEGLSIAADVIVSPDGGSVYVAGKEDDAIVRLRRDPATGRISPRGCVSDDDTGATGCAAHAAGLNGVEPMAISPDGGWLYAGGTLDDSVVRLRLPASGRPRPRGCVDDDTGADACERQANGLDGSHSIVLDPTGASLYAAADQDDAVVRFRRNASP